MERKIRAGSREVVKESSNVTTQPGASLILRDVAFTADVGKE
jgi:hypothetical protein